MKIDLGARPYDVCAFSDALTDVVYQLEVANFERFGLTAGRSVRLSEAQRDGLLAALNDRRPEAITAGGSPANTLCGLSRMGLRCAFLGIIGDDRLGDAYLEALVQAGVEARVTRKRGRNAVCYTLVAVDGERSFGIDLGVAGSLRVAELPLEVIGEARLFHTSAYQLRGSPEAALATERAFEMARSKGTELSLDLGDAGLVAKERERLISLLSSPINLLQANFSEAQALLEDERSSAEVLAEKLRRFADCVVVTCSSEGCVIASSAGAFSSRALPVADAVDFNGAGDAFGAGFLYGRLRGLPIQQAARIGIYYAARVIRKIGAQLSERFVDIASEADAACAALAFDSGSTGSGRKEAS